MIDTQALRNKILDLAMRGKLTEQLPGDGTAEELYQQVQEEKQVLIKEGKIKKEKPLPEITEEDIPFEIPNSWAWFRWGNVSFQIQYGYNAPAQDKGRIRMVRITDIQNNKVVWNTVPYCDIDEDSISEYQLYPNNILFARTGGTVGKSFLVETVEEEAVFAGYLIRTSFSSHISAKYMKYFMDSQLYWKQLRDGTTATAQPNCNAKTLSKMIVPIPPLAEQQRIVEKIDQAFSVLDIIDTLQAQYANNLTTLKAKLIDAAIQGKLTEQLPEDGTAEELYEKIQEEKQALIKAGKIKKEKPLPEIREDETLFEIPKNWKWIRWGDIVNIVSARRVHKADWRESGVPFYRAREIAKLAEDGFVQNDLFISEELFSEFSKTGVPKENDLMVSAVGTLGRTYVVKSSDRFYYKDASVLCFENFGNINPYFLAFAMKSEMMRRQIDNNSGGTTVDTLTMVRMIRYLLALPPLAEQNRIVTRLNEILRMIEA